MKSYEIKNNETDLSIKDNKCVNLKSKIFLEKIVKRNLESLSKRNESLNPFRNWCIMSSIAKYFSNSNYPNPNSRVKPIGMKTCVYGIPRRDHQANESTKPAGALWLVKVSKFITFSISINETYFSV